MLMLAGTECMVDAWDALRYYPPGRFPASIGIAEAKWSRKRGGGGVPAAPARL